jgi:DNA primase
MPLNSERHSNLYKKALDYVMNTRKITQTQIDKFKIGYTETGPRKFRIILPSFNSFGRMNYFEARSYLDNPKIPYWKPDFPHAHDIIFNEHLINWDLPVYLVEGVFDALRIPNAIAMLGKKPAELLLNKLIKNNATVVVCLDADAFKDGLDIYKRLSSLGLNVFFIDLKGRKDISKIFEEDGQEKLNEVLRTACRVDAMFEINKLLNE